jgi:putative membrane protein
MHWDDGGHDNGFGPWWWLFMAITMLVFWGGLAWVVVTLVRHDGAIGRQPPPSVPPPGRQSAEDILHERFARGEIDVDEYHQRVDALRAKRHGEQPPGTP